MDLKDKTKIKIEDLLKSHDEGLTISDIMGYTKLARHTVLARLHRLIGEGKVRMRQINMAKLHYWNDEPTEQELEESLKPKVHVKPILKEHIKKKEIRDSVDLVEENIGEDKTSSKKKSKKKEEVKEEVVSKKPKIDIQRIKQEIAEELKTGVIQKPHAQIREQREPLAKAVEGMTPGEKPIDKDHIQTGIPGLDSMFEMGIPKGSNVLVAGGGSRAESYGLLKRLGVDG